jgi:hypothetical protein
MVRNSADGAIRPGLARETPEAHWPAGNIPGASRGVAHALQSDRGRLPSVGHRTATMIADGKHTDDVGLTASAPYYGFPFEIVPTVLAAIEANL